jgi:hypothetical protein
MNYINTTTNEYPVFEVHIKNRGNGFEEYAVVYNSEIPQYDKVTQMCVEIAPVKIDDSYFRAYELVAKSDKQIADERKASTPKQVTPRQLRLQLLKDGLLDDVETACANSREMQIWFEYVTVFEREHKMVTQMAEQFGLTSEQVDTLFIEANKL